MASDSKTRLRIGVLGASNALHKMWHSIREAGHEVTIVGCRDPARGQAFIDEFCTANGISRKPMIGTYDNVVSSPSVDVVYITIPVALRHKWVLECSKYSKHVVVEKPAAVSCQQLQEWLHLLAAKRLLLVDGTTLSHGCRVREIREVIKSLGQLRRMEAYFAFPATENFITNDIRVDPSLEPTGALGDLGWYCVRYFLHMVDFVLPTKVMGRVAQRGGPKDGITAFAGELVFGAGVESVTASFFCSFYSAHEQLVRIKCDDGIITVHGAINSTDKDAPSFTIERNAFEFGEAAGHPITFSRNVETRHCSEGYFEQSVGLWRDLEAALFCNDPVEPAVVVPERSAEWARAAWVTQCVCDNLLESAKKTAERQAEVEIAFERSKKAEEEAKMKKSEDEEQSRGGPSMKSQLDLLSHRGGEVEL